MLNWPQSLALSLGVCIIPAFELSTLSVTSEENGQYDL